MILLCRWIGKSVGISSDSKWFGSVQRNRLVKQLSEWRSVTFGFGRNDQLRIEIVCIHSCQWWWWRVVWTKKSERHSGKRTHEQSLPGWSCQWYMLVSKTKPCKSKYKLFWRRNCEWLGKTAIISSVMSLLTDNRSNSRANTCWKKVGLAPSCRLDNNTNKWWFIIVFLIAHSSDAPFKFLTYQLMMVR